MIKKEILGKDGKEMVLIPAGDFIMGSEEFEPEMPVRKIYLPDYYIDRYPVTNAEYKIFIDETRSSAPRFWATREVPTGFEDHPVHRITWYEAVEYAQWAGKRLPTEAEWEKAARGTDGRRWPWGNKFSEKNSLVWDRGDYMMTASVYDHPGGASPYGVYEMGGNVEEWTADWYDAYPGSDYQCGAYGKTFKALRGGSSFFTQNHARCAYRCFTRPEDAGIDNIAGCGFRCVLDISESES